ncbi:UNVERIFIED_ORG: hypothetical protein B5F06_13960 [Lacrimispora saccharolytica]
MKDRVLVDMAALAGEIMLVSGAEIYRVEDTIIRILRYSGAAETEVVVMATGIFITLASAEGEPLSVVRRVRKRATNMNRVYRVNDVSRRFCRGTLSLEDSGKQLKEIAGEIQYGRKLRILGYTLTPAAFAIMFGGGWLEVLAAGAFGMVMALLEILIGRVRLNDFCSSASEAFIAAFLSLAVQAAFLPSLNIDAVIISDLMPLVPGVTFTSAIRDTLNGDYTSGIARILEAIVVALAVASGTGAAMMLVGMLGGAV